MGAPPTTACAPWATEADVCSPCDDYDFPSPIMADALQVATDVLFVLSGSRWSGVCEDVVRPQGSGGCEFALWGMAWYARTGRWPAPWDYPAGYRGGCGCGGVSEVLLGGWPIVAVSEVLLNGAVLPADQYRVDDYATLVRLPDADGNRMAWPCWQLLDLPTTEDGTWEVSYTYGTAPPAMGVRAAASLACQLALSCSPETAGGECRLPERVTSITRQGVTAVVLDPFSFLDNGRTGIYDVDLFLAAANPGGVTRRGTSTSPQSRQRRARRAGT